MLRTSHRLRPTLHTTLLATLAAAAVALPAVSATGATGAADPSGACADPDGVTVVVDATELGGDVVVGCAPSPATGTEALAQAGFTEARDPSGLLCAIEGLPDPCPTEFTGSWWVYWSAAPDGEWVSAMEGPDTATPAAGSVEGWRYGDGTVPPDALPAEVAPGTGDAEVPDEAEPETGADAVAAPDAEATAEPGEDALLDGIPEAWRPVVGVAGGLAVLAALALVIVRVRRAARERGED